MMSECADPSKIPHNLGKILMLSFAISFSFLFRFTKKGGWYFSKKTCKHHLLPFFHAVIFTTPFLIYDRRWDCGAQGTLKKTHLDRDKVESNLSVPGIQGCHENVFYKNFETSPHLTCLCASTNIPLVPAQIQTWSRGWPLKGSWSLPRDMSSRGSFRSSR